MQTNQHCRLIFFILLIIVPVSLIAQEAVESPRITLQNKVVRFDFEPTYGGLVSIIDISSGVNHMLEVKEKRTLWNLNFNQGSNKRTLSSTELPLSHSAVTELAGGGSKLTLEWNHL